jgi:hypothetical protein
MKFANMVFSLLSLGLSTIVTVSLVGSLAVWATDELGPGAQSVLVRGSMPWLSAQATVPVQEHVKQTHSAIGSPKGAESGSIH